MAVDAVVIGGGHNGLVAATLLARAGWSVEVLEQAEVAGGAVGSLMTSRGYLHDWGAAFFGVLHDSPVFDELGLADRVQWASTGLPEIDYLLADPISVPPDQRAHFTESLWYLPDTRLCFTPPAGADVPQVSGPPALHAGHITFGSFQRLTKLNDGVLGLWARVLQAVPGSRLRLQSEQMKDRTAGTQLLHRLVSAGIVATRVQLAEAGTRIEYLAAHAEVDILLDTFPHSGATTTCEALWMGVPTVTLSGTTMLARQGASLLTCAGLSEWIASDEDDYVARAVRHAGDLESLARLRTGLREQVAASPLFDAARFTQLLQKAVRGMWQQKACGLSVENAASAHAQPAAPAAGYQ